MRNHQFTWSVRMRFSQEDIAKLKRKLEVNGFLKMGGIKNEKDYLQLAKEFGDFLPQYDGQEVWSIKADPKFDNHYHSLNTKKLSPHTECYEFTGLPPKYLALWCLKAPNCGGGKTTLMDARKYFYSLPDQVVTYLKNNEFEFSSSSGIQESALGRIAKHKIISEHEGEEIIRFSANCINTKADIKVNGVIKGFVEEFESNHMALDWHDGDFLIWNNRRVVHSRTEYKDRTRELRRVWLG